MILRKKQMCAFYRFERDFVIGLYKEGYSNNSDCGNCQLNFKKLTEIYSLLFLNKVVE